MYPIYFSLFFTTLISSVAVVSTVWQHDDIYIGYDLLFYYLVIDMFRYFVFDRKNINATIIIHHIIGLYYVYIVYNNYETKKEFDKFLLYELSTIFLNIYLLNKSHLNFFMFFISFTVVRIIIGSYNVYLMLNGSYLSYYNKIIAILFQGINYYWYLYILYKIYNFYKPYRNIKL